MSAVPKSGARGIRRRWMILAVVVLVGAMVMQLAARRHELVNLQQLSVTVLVAAVGLQFASQLMWNAATLLPLRPYAKDLSFWELYLVRMGGFIVGGLVPVAGNFALRLAYFRRHGVSSADFTWATIIVNVVGLLASGLLGLGGLLALLLTASAGVDRVVVALVAVVLAAGIAAMIAMQMLPRVRQFPFTARWPALREASAAMEMRHSTGGVLVLSVLRHAFLFASFGLLYECLSRSAGGFLSGGLVYAISSPIRILAITPGGNVGVNEWAIAMVGKPLSFDVTTGLMVGLLSRVLALAGQALGIGVGGAVMALGGRPAFARLRQSLR